MLTEAVSPQVDPFQDIIPMGNFQSPRAILVVGCGGTGAHVAGHLAHLVSTLPLAIRLVFADGDKVEQKNLERQHFIRQDMGLNKAEVLAARYSVAFGVEIGMVPSYLEDVAAVDKIAPDLVIGCVDNNASRRILHAWFNAGNYNRGRFWIDAGNEEGSGQVICGFDTPSYGSCHGMFCLPSVAEVYPDVLDEKGKFNSQLSCAELAVSPPQGMMANVTAATLVLNFAQKIMRGQTLRAHGVVFSVDNSFRTMLNTPENLVKVSPTRRRAWDRFGLNRENWDTLMERGKR